MRRVERSKLFGMHLVVALGGLDEGADRRRCGIEDRDLVLGDRLPEAAGVGIRRDAFEDDLGAAERERPVGDVGVAGDPADVGGAPEDVVGLEVEGPLRRQRRVQQVAARRVLDALGLAGRPRRVEQEQRMLGEHPFRLARRRLLLDQLVQPLVARRREVDLAAGAAVDDDVAHRHVRPVSASSTIAFSGSALPPRSCSSAVITMTAPVSAMRSRRLCAEKPPNTTEWIAPIRAHASIATTPSIDIGT
jgi:hypothetical protein